MIIDSNSMQALDASKIDGYVLCLLVMNKYYTEFALNWAYKIIKFTILILCGENQSPSCGVKCNAPDNQKI